MRVSTQNAGKFTVALISTSQLHHPSAIHWITSDRHKERYGLISLFERLADAWIGRSAIRDAVAVQAVEGLKPAVVITGASRGIGLALARAFAADYEAVVMIARTHDKLAKAADSIKQDGQAECQVEALALACDLRSPEATRQIEALLDEHGLYCDLLINNAAIGLGGEFIQQHSGSVQALIDLNVSALTRTMHHFLPGMLARGRGGIINVASLGGYVPGPYQAQYYASKAYVISLTAAVAQEVSGRGVRIASVSPGPVETSIHASMGANDALYRLLLPSMTTRKVAASVRRGYRLGSSAITPGILNWLVARVSGLVPHWLLAPLVGMILKPRPSADKA